MGELSPVPREDSMAQNRFWDYAAAILAGVEMEKRMRSNSRSSEATAAPPFTGARTIQIAIDANHVAVVNEVVQAVERCWRRWGEAQLPGLRVDRQGGVRCPAGLVPDLVRELEADGYRAEVCDRRHTLVVDGEVLQTAAGADRRFLEAVALAPLGIVEVRDARDLVDRVALLAEMYPAAHLVLAVVTRRSAWEMWKMLRGTMGELAVGLLSAKTRRPGRRCTVCTYRSLARVRQRDHAILVIEAAERATDAVVPFTSGARAYARVYGTVYAGVPRDETTALRLRALAGEVIYAMPGTTAPARVLLVAAPSVPPTGAKHGSQRRRQIWENRPRNRLVARLALALRDGDVDGLRACGLAVSAEDLGADPRRVTVLVEGTAHARELRSLLGGWPVRDLVPRERRDLHSLLAATASTESGNSVVTLLHATLVGMEADIVVRATGGSGEWLAQGSPAEPPGRVPLIIDIADTCDDQPHTDTHHRISDYRRRGWIVEGSPT